jgi:ABC-type transport system involved in cytochrome bd biosynthesis fused ATPase/permease subunit
VEMENVKKSGPDSIYSKIAYLSQFPYILEDTVRNNLTFGISGDVADSEIREVLKEVGLNERFSNLNEKLNGGSGDAGTTSGGETSRIGLARAILKMRKNDSRIVFLDEPTASVDEKTAMNIADIINMEKQKNPDVTFISISHDRNYNEKLETSMPIRMKNGRIEA